MAPKEEPASDDSNSNEGASPKRVGEPLTPPTATSSSEHPHGASKQPAKVWPEEEGNWFQQVFQSLTFSYMRPLLQKGKRQFLDGDHLTQEDLYQVPPSMTAKDLVITFRQYYQEERGALLTVLWKLAAPTFVPAGFFQLVYVAARVSLPLAMRSLLMALEDNPNQAVIREGLPYVVVIFVAAVTAAFAQHRQVHLATKSGIIMRAALISTIYEHSLRLSSSGKAGLTVGEVTNLVATDTQKIFEVTLEGHLIWSCPVFVVIVTALLWVVMGPELIVGVFVLIGFVPIVKMIVSRMLKIRKQRAILTDERINIITAMLQGIRVTKLNAWNDLALDRIEGVRKQEIKLLRSELFMWGWTMVSAVCSPLLATAVSFSFYTLVNEENIITPASAFTVLLLFSILRFPINMGARLVGKLAQALDSAKRISEFLQRETQSDSALLLEDSKEDSNDNTLVRLVNATYKVKGQSRESTSTDKDTDSASSATFAVRDVNMTVNRSQVLAVVGSVGSGKSVLLQGLLGELEAAPNSDVDIKGSVGYAAQVPFVLNQSLRDNILFGASFDQTKYQRVLAACSLEQDIQRFPGGDMCQIGERGITLSGGQKQRVSLARVLYAEPDVALLDDVFSALDAQTARAVFDGLFGLNGALKLQATVLVTHATKFLQHMDNLVVLSEGSAVFSGSYSELLDMKDHAAIEALDQDGIEAADNACEDGGIQEEEVIERGEDEQDQMIMTTEDREFGLSKFRVWLIWFQYAGWSFLPIQILLLAFDRTMYVASEWWISRWAEAASEGVEVFGRDFPPQTDGREAQVQYIAVYFIILAFSIFGTTLRSHWGVQGGARCAERLFTIMATSVLGAPLSYFETTPLGRILNRFTYDVEVLDIELSVSMSGLLISCSWFTASIVVMISILPWIICVLVPVVGVYFVLQSYHRRTGPDLQRLDAMSRSPLQAQLAEGLDGATTIRAYKRQEFFVDIFHSSVDLNSSAMLHYDAAQQWLALRIELLGSIITLSACLMVVFGNDTLNLSSRLVGFLIIWSIVFTTALGFFLQRFTETEARITAIERIQSTSKLPQEAAWKTNPAVAQLETSWPSKGELHFENVSLRYRKGLPLALDSVSFHLPPGTRCGVVGRTGSGKSTLTVALFRLVEIESGRITLDGVDLSGLGLSDVRGRKQGLRIIPQDPVLFSGSLRDCLDPFTTETDEDLLDALKAVNHTGWERGLPVLSDRVDEGGANYSVGERQLLCLARAIVEEPRVLVMDEASASLDNESDKRIQSMLRNRFQNTTMLTIAHRIDTILDYDQILVLENGRLAEFGPPQELLNDPNGIFTSLLGQTAPGAGAKSDPM